MEGMDLDKGDGSGSGALEKLSNKLNQFLIDAKGVKSRQYLLSLAQLCYADTQLAYDTWVQLFPMIWAVLSVRQRQVSVMVEHHGRLSLTSDVPPRPSSPSPSLPSPPLSSSPSPPLPSPPLPSPPLPRRCLAS